MPGSGQRSAAGLLKNRDGHQFRAGIPGEIRGGRGRNGVAVPGFSGRRLIADRSPEGLTSCLLNNELASSSQWQG